MKNIQFIVKIILSMFLLVTSSKCLYNAYQVVSDWQVVFAIDARVLIPVVVFGVTGALLILWYGAEDQDSEEEAKEEKFE